jgi:hypothetical protein
MTQGISMTMYVMKKIETAIEYWDSEAPIASGIPATLTLPTDTS